MIRLDVLDRVAWITFDRPERKNAFTDAMWEQLLAVLDRVLADREVRVAVLCGAGEDFTAGADVSLVEGQGRGESDGPHPFLGVLEHLVDTFDKPLLAAVDGVAVGFGLTVLLHCDFVYVTDRARLRAPFVRLGVVPEAASSYLLPALLGVRQATELLFAADFVSGARAAEMGLASECVPHASLREVVAAKAARVAENPPDAMRATKRLLLETRRTLVRDAVARENAAFAQRMGTPENREAIAAFYEKRAPDFSKT